MIVYTVMERVNLREPWRPVGFCERAVAEQYIKDTQKMYRGRKLRPPESRIIEVVEDHPW